MKIARKVTDRMYGLVAIALFAALLVGCSSKSVALSPTTSLRFIAENVKVNVVWNNWYVKSKAN